MRSKFPSFFRKEKKNERRKEGRRKEAQKKKKTNLHTRQEPSAPPSAQGQKHLKVEGLPGLCYQKSVLYNMSILVPAGSLGL